MVVGSLGDVYFVASTRTLRTISDYSRKVSARYAEHAILLNKPKLEYVGPNLEEISFSIQLHTMYGVTPEEEFEQLKEYVENGAVVDFVLNNTPIGNAQWVVKEADMSDVLFGPKGGIIYAKVNVTLSEYINDTIITTKEVADSATQSSN